MAVHGLGKGLDTLIPSVDAVKNISKGNAEQTDKVVSKINRCQTIHCSTI